MSGLRRKAVFSSFLQKRYIISGLVRGLFLLACVVNVRVQPVNFEAREKIDHERPNGRSIAVPYGGS
eukprot:583557-Amphidinium_carterae.1